MNVHSLREWITVQAVIGDDFATQRCLGELKGALRRNDWGD